MTEPHQAAYARYQAGDTAGAAQLCQQLLQQQPRNAEAVYLLGAIAQDAGQTQEASARFRQSALLAPGNPVFINALGEALLTLSDPLEALTCFRQAIAV